MFIFNTLGTQRASSKNINSQTSSSDTLNTAVDLAIIYCLGYVKILMMMTNDDDNDDELDQQITTS